MESWRLQDARDSYDAAVAALRRRHLGVVSEDMGGVVVHFGDCREVMPTLAQVDSVVCDPPYHLTSIVKRFGATSQNDATKTSERARGRLDGMARLSRGFMGQQWDGGDVAFDPETWRRCFDLLKPGGHLVAFSGTRTYHRMACAVEDAGFEIRDQLAWVYGSGFPKSLDVSKAIDKRKNWVALPKLQGAIRAARTALGISQSEAARRMGLIGPGEQLGGGGFMWFETGMRMVTREQWPRLKTILGISDEFDLCFEEAEREITGTVEEWTDRSNYALTSKDGLRRDKPASDLAAAWQGWGTALKPAWEPIVLARKPLDGTVAQNVLQHGTGALNVDGCRVETDADLGRNNSARSNGTSYVVQREDRFIDNSTGKGRWPANLIHDGSEEVVGMFPDAPGQLADASTNSEQRKTQNVYGVMKRGNGRDGEASADRRYEDEGGTNFAALPGQRRNDSGSAARFFYCAKADKADRAGSKHPTVKPVDLMRWLVRLVTPPGGTVLDPFAGTGTTGQAALMEGMKAILIEQSDEYAEDIRRRMDRPIQLGGLI